MLLGWLVQSPVSGSIWAWGGGFTHRAIPETAQSTAAFLGFFGGTKLILLLKPLTVIWSWRPQGNAMSTGEAVLGFQHFPRVTRLGVGKQSFAESV